MKNILASSILALASLTFISPAADAAITYNSEDIVVAFSNQPTPNHSGNTYLVDFGNASLFKTGGLYADGNLHVVNMPTAATFLTDLTAAGITSGNRTWSLQGANDTILDSFLSRAEPAPGIASTPFTNGSGIGNGNTDLLTLFFSFGTAAAVSTTPNSFTQSTLDDPSYGRLVFGTTSPTLAYETWGNPEAPLSGVLDLYQIVDGPATPALRLGAFDYDASTGIIRFSSDINDFNPVPEPSTIGFGLLALGACFARRHRRAPATA